jgi:hypothetical protein
MTQPETVTNFVLIYSETCIRAGEVAISEMNSELFADCQGNSDDLADAFGDCVVLDREAAKLWAEEPSNARWTPSLSWRMKSGKNALEYFGDD